MTVKEFTSDSLYNTLKDIDVGSGICVFDREKCAELAPLINEINRLKAEKNAVILCHSYVSPEIIHGVADIVGDSYELSKKAKETDADTIVFVAVKFMAETAKILNPDKQVLIPSKYNGCTLADSITADQVKALREQYPEHTFVCYINTTAAVKAQCDVCVTSSNVYRIVETLPNDKIVFLPDALMGKNVVKEMKRRGVEKDIVLWDGTCYVHEEYDPDMITFLRDKHPGLEVLAHPECSPEVLAASDYVGSTSQMISEVKTSSKDTFLMLTECGLSARLQLEVPEKTFVGSCTMCRYMKSNQLEDIKRVLEHPDPDDIVVLDDALRQEAKACIDAMFSLA